MLRSLLGIGFHGCALFLLPFLIGFAAALFFEVSEVAETLPVLMALALLLLVPAWFCQMFGALLKSRRELEFLKQQGRLDAAAGLRTLLRHIRIVTPRGFAVLASGLLFVVCALGLKWADLSLVAVISLLLFYGVTGLVSFISTFLIRTFETGLQQGTITRAVVPAVVNAGDAAEERFTFRQVPVPPGFFLLIEDLLPPRLGTRSRYAVGAGAAAHTELIVAGRLRRSPRGFYQLGPAEVYYSDLFGFTRIALASVATAELKVLPGFRPLHIIEPPRSRTEVPDVLTRPHRFPTEDWFRFREYQPGDDSRRIQWKLSVRSGQLQVRQPETREISTRSVLLALDSYLPAGRMLEDAVGLEEVLDQLVETWISLAKELTERGDKVTLIAAARGSRGETVAESVACGRGGHLRWQDLGARVIWQGAFEIPTLLATLGDDQHAVVVSSRFQTPPPVQTGHKLTWIFLPPHRALGDSDPTLLETLAGTPLRAFSYLFRLPYVAGADENGFLAQLQTVRYHRARLAARQRLRAYARAYGEQVFRALIAQGAVVYRLEPQAGAYRLVGVSGG